MVGDNIEQPQVMSLRDALRLADEMELDLIEISPKAEDRKSTRLNSSH